MIWKTLVFAFLLAGVIADEVAVSGSQKEQFKEMLRKQCQKVGADESKVEEITTAAHGFLDCLKQLVNVEQLKEEIKLAKPNGALDEVFKKYCAKTPQLKTCIHTLLDQLSPCLDTSSRDQINSAKNGTDQLIDFVCYKDGDRIALFISEHGPECFQDKANTIRECGLKLKDGVTTVEDAQALTIVSKCTKFDELSTCIVTALEQCNTPTPGNMAEALFRYVRKGSPCNTALPKY